MRLYKMVYRLDQFSVVLYKRILGQRKNFLMDCIQRDVHKRAQNKGDERGGLYYTSIVFDIVRWLAYISCTRHFGCWLIYFIF